MGADGGSRFVRTDMGNEGARLLGVEESQMEAEESVGGMVTLIDGAGKATHGGRMWEWTGVEAAW